MTVMKRLRLSIDFTVTIADMPPETSERNPFDPVYHGYQVRLLEAVKNNIEVFTRWLRSLITDKMMEHGRWDWDDMLMGVLPGEDVDSKMLLAPALSMLSQDDQEFFHDTGDLDFSDITDLFRASFTVKEESPVITELEE